MNVVGTYVLVILAAPVLWMAGLGLLHLARKVEERLK